MNNKKIAVIGAGISGLVSGYRLAKKGFKVKIFEAGNQLGGLARTIKIKGQPIEAFYHHFFPGDNYFFAICEELGIADRVFWREAKMGYLSEGETFDFGTPTSLLKFKPLSLKEKVRFALSVLKIKKEPSLEDMDSYTAQEWLIKNAGEEAFDKVWKPLLIQKFGEYYQNISMAWLWKKMKARNLSQNNFFRGESLAYLNGSLDIFLKKLSEQIANLGGEIALSEKVTSIESPTDKCYEVNTDKSKETFDIVISTVAPQVLSGITEFPVGFNQKLKGFKFMGVICVLMVLKKPLTNYYWLNIGDNSFPFGLLVEHTNFCGAENYDGKHIVYLSKYLDTGNRLYSEFTDEQITELFLKNVYRINKDFSKEWVDEVHIFRESFAQPIIGKNYLSIKPAYLTPLPNFYWLSTAHIFPDDRGVNHSIRIAEELVQAIGV